MSASLVLTILCSKDDGESYEEVADISHCAKCGFKTVICPHRREPREDAIKLPPQASFLKLQPVESSTESNCDSEARMAKLVDNVKFSLLETLTTLEEIWDDIGLKDELKGQRHDTITTHLQEMLSEMLAEECDLKAKMQLSVEEYQKELDQLRLELHMSIAADISEEVSLVEVEKKLRNGVDTLNKEKHDRLKWLRRLRGEEQSICEELLMTQYELNFVGTPTLEQLRELEQRVSYLKAQKRERYSAFTKSRTEIISLWEKLDAEPVDEFENNILKPDVFILSSQNIEKLSRLKSNLEAEHVEMLLNIERKREEYKLLWNRLGPQLGEVEKKGFQVISDESTRRTLRTLLHNIEELHEFKRRHLQSFIMSIREELSMLWDKCYYGEEQRHAFQTFYEGIYTEETLAEHEHQLKSLQYYYEHCKDLLKLIAKREAIWEEKLNYEDNEKDNLRFNNRGGALFKALKKKEFIDKQLPKIETQLCVKIEKWEKDNESYFIYKDVRYVDHMSSQRQDYEESQQLKKEQKLRAKLADSPLGISKGVKRKPLGVRDSRIESPVKKCQLTYVKGNHSVNTTCVRSPIMKKTKFTAKTEPRLNSSKYTHSSLQASKNAKKPIISKLTTESMKKSWKRRSIKATRVLREKNDNVADNITILSYNAFKGGVPDEPLFQSSFIKS